MRHERSSIYHPSDQEYSITLSEADIKRVASALAVAAHNILELDERGTKAPAYQALELREEILAKYRQEKYDD